jgi:hypothetical protein
MTAYDTAVLDAIAKGPDYVGWYKVEQRLSSVALDQRDRLPDALKRLLAANYIEESQSAPGTYRATGRGRDALAAPVQLRQISQPPRRLAWFFTTTVMGREEIKKVLEALTATPWELYDSDTRPDFVSGWISPVASLALVSHGKNCVATLSVLVGDGDVDRRIEDAKQRVLAEILPALGASNIKETAPSERE